MVDLESTAFERGWTGALGASFIGAGILGFMSGDHLWFLGLSEIHNLAHLVTGIVAILFALLAGGTYAARFNQVIGLSYAGFAILGFIGFPDFLVGLFNLNEGTNWFHLAVGLATLVVGIGIELPYKYTPDWWKTS